MTVVEAAKLAGGYDFAWLELHGSAAVAALDFLSDHVHDLVP